MDGAKKNRFKNMSNMNFLVITYRANALINQIIKNPNLFIENCKLYVVSLQKITINKLRK